MIQRLRSLGIDWTCVMMNWASETFVSSEGPITISDLFGWWLESLGSRLFGFFYAGSDEEILSALHGETPRRYMNDRQRQFVREALGASDDHRWHGIFDDFFCAECDAELLVSDETDICAGCRALHPEMLLEDRK